MNYSIREECKNIEDIKNDLIRVAFEKLKVKPINCSLTSDIFSTGSGLASSSFLLLSNAGIALIPPGLEGLRLLADAPSVPVTLSPLAQSSPVIFKPADCPSPVILDCVRAGISLELDNASLDCP